MRYFKRLLLGKTLENVMSHEISRNVLACKLMFGYIILVTLERIVFFWKLFTYLKKKKGRPDFYVMKAAVWTFPKCSNK